MIHVFGTVCLDRMRRVPSLPGPGGYVSVESEEVRVGGESANTAYALAGWGVPLRLLGNAVEPEVRQMIGALGLPTKDLSERPGTAPVCDIYVTPDGQRTMFGVGFGDMARTIDVPSLSLSEPGWFTIDMNFGDVGVEVIAKAKASGQKMYVMDVPDPAGFTPGDIWQSSTDWHGVPGATKANLTWAERHAKDWRATVILTDSGRELVVATPDGNAKAYPTFPPPLSETGSVGELDSTGAGDRFRAGMLFGLHSDWALERCLAFAAAAAAMKLAHPGAIAPVPTLEEVEAFQRLHSTVLNSFSA